MIVNVHSRQKIQLFVSYEEFKFFHKLLFGVSLGGAITHMLPGYKEEEMFRAMLERMEAANKNLDTKQINL